ncbi:MAG: type II toxin-antitoxin system MqsA family antitoxin [Methanothrix sp.]|nr:type II toxin-antitoxin system MqsA family antitoxin [Methanothrix sp.]MDD4447658.1 type II toxin-antitoxin system MqsA family antitoxin [Methanothrix sp.]
MKCVICKKAFTKPGTTSITLERGCLTMVVKCVPAQVCPNCGEAYISEEVTAKLLKDAEERVRTGAQVEICNYVAA